MDRIRTDLRALRPLLFALNDGKRIRSSDAPTHSISQRAFARSWRDLCAGEAVEAVALREAAAAVAAVELGAIDVGALRLGGLDDEAITRVFGRAIAKAGAVLSCSMRERLVAAWPGLLARQGDGDAPSFVSRLQQQPRAGATHPSAGRLVLEPAESHADHCQVVAVAAVLIAGQTDTDVVLPFLAGLAHHLHNASLPDGGFAAEELLGDQLQPVVERLRDDALGQLPATLAAQVRRACASMACADDATSQAFHAADVIDRVVEAAHFDRVARFRLAEALGPYGLVHPGPLKPFQDSVLAELGLSA